MSYNVSEEWYYYLRGRELILYQLLGGSTNERITQTGVLRTRDNELMYPNENIADGLRIEYTALDEPFVKEALEDTNIYGNGTNISFGEGTGAGSTDTIDSTSEVKNFSVGDKVRIIKDIPSVDGMLHKDRIVKIDEIKNNKIRVKCSLGKIWWIESSHVSASFL